MPRPRKPRIITDQRGREYKLRSPSGHTNRGAPGVMRCANQFANDDGYGPEGLVCAECEHCRNYARSVYKCKLFETRGPASDIRASDPACKKFAPDPWLPPVARGWSHFDRMTPPPCWQERNGVRCGSTDRAGDYPKPATLCPKCLPPVIHTFGGHQTVDIEYALERRRQRTEAELHAMLHAQERRRLHVAARGVASCV